MKVSKILSILAILCIWCWIVAALAKQDKSQGCLKPSYVVGPAVWPVSGEGGCSEEGGLKR